MRLRTGSLFSGYGGLDLAVNAFYGSETAWHVEYEAAPSKILAHHWPNIPNHGDVTQIDWNAVEPIDILTGGYPCQPFSAAGRRQGTNDERHLWPYVREAIRHLRPRLTVLENVAGHRSLGFDRVLGDLAEDGMHAWWTSVRASDVGACHRRERLFILASPADADSLSVRQQPVPEPWCRSTPLAGRPDASDRGLTYLPTLAANLGEHRRDRGQDPDKRRAAGRQVSTADVVCYLPTPRTSDANGPGAHGAGGLDLRTAVVEWGDYEAAIRRAEQVTGRPVPVPTEPNRNGNPRLAPAFAEWMMMLPAGWVTDPAIGLSRNDQLKAIGNGVCPPQAYQALEFLHHIAFLEEVA